MLKELGFTKKALIRCCSCDGHPNDAFLGKQFGPESFKTTNSVSFSKIICPGFG